MHVIDFLHVHSETKVNQQFPHEQLDFRSVLKTDRYEMHKAVLFLWNQKTD